MDKLIAHLVLALLVSGVCAVLLRFIRMHGALKALNALLIASFFSIPASVCVVLVSTATAWIINKRRARRPA